MFIKEKKNIILDHLSQNNNNFDLNRFKELVYSEKGFNSLKYNIEDYKYSETIKKQMIENLMKCDNNTLHQLIFYTENNDPQNLKSNYFSQVAFMLSILSIVFALLPDKIKNSIYVLFFLGGVYLLFFVVSIKSNTLGKISTFSYLNNLCKQVLTEKKES